MSEQVKQIIFAELISGVNAAVKGYRKRAPVNFMPHFTNKITHDYFSCSLHYGEFKINGQEQHSVLSLSNIRIKPEHQGRGVMTHFVRNIPFHPDVGYVVFRSVPNDHFSVYLDRVGYWEDKIQPMNWWLKTSSWMWPMPEPPPQFE